MITQSFLVGFVGKTSENSSGVKKNDTKTSGSYPSFIDSLNASVEKNSTNKSNRNIQKSKDFIAGMRMDKRNVRPEELSSKTVDKESEDTKVDSYMQAVKERGQMTDKKKVAGSEEKNAWKKESAKKTSDQETGNLEEAIVEESLAQILNISVEELKKIMSTLNILPEELCDETKTSEIAEKIADMFGLDNGQKATLIKITELTLKASESSGNALEIQDAEKQVTISKEDWVKLEGVEVEVVDVSKRDKKVQTHSSEVLESKLKEVLNNLRDKLEKEPEKLLEEITQTVEGVMPKEIKPANEKVVLETDNNEADLTAVDNKDVKASKTLDESGESKEELLSDNEEKTLQIQKGPEGKTLVSNPAEVEESQFNSILNNQHIKTGSATEIPEVKTDVAVSKKEIISQIVEKAKVVLTDEKSEMVIDLKPDHLGKLSLVIVTERGSVMAKFVAENEQVKAAIESNMDNLKESLTKQGFSVQGFSVSVGQEPRKGFNESNRFSKGKSSSGSVKTVTTSEVGGVAALEENQVRLNPYMVSSNSIDLTA